MSSFALPTLSQAKIPKVLLVEDNAVDALFFRSILMAENAPLIELAEADTFAKAQRLIENDLFDAIILDLNLPDSQGLATIERVRQIGENGARPAIIVLTQASDEAQAMEGLQKGAQEYLIKSETDARWLKRSLRYAIARKRQEDALQKTQRETEQLRLRHQAVLRSTPNALCLLNNSWIIVWSNYALNMLLDPDQTGSMDYAGKSFSILFPDESSFKEYRHAALMGLKSSGMDLREITLWNSPKKQLCFQASLVRLDPKQTDAGLLVTLNDITQRKAAEKGIRQREALYRLVVDHVRASISIVDHEGQFHFLNKAAAAKQGGTPEGLAGKNLYDIFPPELARRHHEAIKKVITSGTSHSTEVFTQGDGGMRWFDINLQPILDSDGKPGACQVIANDITERKRFEKEREALFRLAKRLCSVTSTKNLGQILSEECYQLFKFDAFWFVIVDPNKRLLRNVVMLDTPMGADAPVTVDIETTQEGALEGKLFLTGESCLENRPEPPVETPYTRFGFEERLSRSMMFAPVIGEGEVIAAFSVQSYTPGRYIQDDLRLLRTMADQCAGALARIRAGEGLRASETRFRTLVEQLPGITYMSEMDNPDRTQYCSPQVEKYLGYTVEDIKKEPDLWLKILHPDDRSKAAERLGRRISPKTAYEMESRFRHRDGRWLTFLDRATILTDEQGLATKVLGIAIDITEQKRAAEELRQIHQIYRTAIENSGGVPYLLNFANQQYEYMGEGCEKLLGAPREKLNQFFVRSMTREVVLYEPTSLLSIEEYAQAFLRGEVAQWVAEYRMVLPSGEEKWLSDDSIPIQDPATGQVIQSLGILHDITSRKRAEIALRESKVEMESIYNGVADGILVADVETQRFLRCNPAMSVLTGYSEAELLSMSVKDLHPPDQMDRVADHFLKMVRAQHETILNLPVRKKDGSIFLADISGHFLLYQERSCIVGLFSDATERNRAQEAQRRIETHLRIILNQIPAFIAATDRDLRVVSCAGMGLKRINTQAQDMIGKTMQDAFNTTDEDFLPIRAAKRALAGESVSYDMDWMGASFQTHLEPLRNAASEITGVIGITVDVTDLMQATHERERLQTEIIQKERLAAIGETTASIAHSMKNIATALQGAAFLLKEALDKGEYASAYRSHDILNRANLRLYILLSNLLDYGKQREAAREEILLTQAFEEAKNMLEYAARSAKVEIAWNVQPEDEKILADNARLNQVLLNLGMNAIDAMGGPAGGGILRFQASRRPIGPRGEHCISPPKAAPHDSDQPFTILEIMDDGLGIPQRIRDQIFDPFFSTKGSRGTGLGLPSAVNFMADHGGYIEVESVEGEGTTARLIFPPWELQF